MYSYEDRIRAVELYIKLGKRTSPTIRQLGYPGRGTLTKWVREAFPEARMALVGSVGQRRYPESLKQAGVMELCTRQESAQAVADRLPACRPPFWNLEKQPLWGGGPALIKNTER